MWFVLSYSLDKKEGLRDKKMTKPIIDHMKNGVWEKSPHVTTEYILCCILEELTEMNETLKKRVK